MKNNRNEMSNYIKTQKKNAANMNELLDYMINLIESKDDRFSFEHGVGGVNAEFVIYDKLKEIGYVVKIDKIEYDQDGNAINL